MAIAALELFEQHQSRSLMVWSAKGTLYCHESEQFKRAEPKMVQHLTSEKSLLNEYSHSETGYHVTPSGVQRQCKNTYTHEKHHLPAGLNDDFE